MGRKWYSRWETKKRIWSLNRTVWKWLPEITDQRPDIWSVWWGCLSLEWISKEWLDYCERKSCTLADTMAWVTEQVMAQEENE